ncbi:hypothetical protein CkaCkLH20_08151 [Colletotrichum karsti]|uniref:Secondary metabolism regulator LAE1 n=1 Tax=Colletotrichum karsti TaxID=1095194 RepID=A0A9P6LI17_9PEZI|nr:uncharacterized protein CkaCkLH20_08151 [Colletotrichum karsti]KAF9874168.1 hypothetical protein CkaCkLH20_08151 [Colletotrichum karsti]
MADTETAAKGHKSPSSAGSPAPAGNPHGPILVAEDDNLTDDAASDRAPSLASSTASLTSSIQESRMENGRTYHRYMEGKYLFPNDERENDRLDLQHNLYLLTLDYRLGLAPPNDGNSGVKRVLDVGTGTGLWAIEFAEEHPEAEVIGVDLSPVQTTFIPPNCRFEIDDIEQPWSYTQPFDYIHIRGMTSSISDWPDFFKKMYNGLAPGGYIELFEGHAHTQSDDGSLTPDHAWSKCWDLLSKSSEILGRPFVHVPSLAPMLEEAGFVDVAIVPYKWPIGPWAKDPHYKLLGEWAHRNAAEGLEAWLMAALTRALEWTSEEVQVMLVDVRKDLNNRNIHHYCPL